MIEDFKLKVFRMVANDLNYYRATDEPYITQSAITAQIRFLAS
jgi:DNA-binding transcriptional LysR family regulator